MKLFTAFAWLLAALVAPMRSDAAHPYNVPRQADVDLSGYCRAGEDEAAEQGCKVAAGNCNCHLGAPAIADEEYWC